MWDLPNAVVKRLLSKHGDGLRVSGSAIEQAVAAICVVLYPDLAPGRRVEMLDILD